MLNTNDANISIRLINSLSSQILGFAMSSGLMVRKSKSFKPNIFLLALLKAANGGKATFNKLAMLLEDLDPECKVTPQALCKRLNRADCMLETFITKCIALVISDGVPEAKQHNNKFKRILTEDSSFVKMTKLCAEEFPAHGNKYGSTAGLKLNMNFDLITGETVELSTHYGTQQDRDIAWGVLDLAKKGDLILRDMGYFNVAIFKEIQAIGADWLSRIPSSVNVFSQSEVKLEELLKNSKSAIIDRKMEMTRSGFNFRVIAIRKHKADGDKAVRDLKEKFKKLGKTPTQKALTRARWYLLATSVSKDRMTAKELSRLYAQRWQIEIVFKAWKQASHLVESLSQRSNYQHLLGIFLSEVFMLAVTMHHYVKLRVGDRQGARRLSIMKLFEWVGTKLGSSKTLRKIFTSKPSQNLISTQSRKRESQISNMLDLLG